MGVVETSLAAMGTLQFILGNVFLGSYALALGRLMGRRGRRIAVGAAIFSAAGFVVLSHPWEGGIILIAFTLVIVGLFAGIAWASWRLAVRRGLHNATRGAAEWR